MTTQWMIHDSFQSFYRNPFGAVACGEELIIRIKVAENHPIQNVKFHLHKDANEQETFFMNEIRTEECSYYEVTFQAPNQQQLLWYYFEFERDGRTYYYGKQPDLYGGIGQIYDHIPPAYQITVHLPDAKTPNWLKESIIYQIFVDRFFNGNEDGRIDHKKKNSVIHSHWDNDPIYIKDETGRVVRWDFFGGNLLGIKKKLSYLKSLGVDIIYLNPIFESSSNHKYDTGDYHKIDPMFGDLEIFRELVAEAKKIGISIILDGVFSHTGSDSKYFNREGNYDSIGAYQSKESPYYEWYRFINHPDEYESWWGIDVLPNVDEENPSYQNFIIHDENSVLRTWMREGIRGWRLDVADELPPSFIKKFRKVMKEQDPDSVLIGEVWEDASNKISYGIRREYLLGEELDSVMNYPFRKILLDFVLGYKDSFATERALMTLYENYPKHHFYSLMNLLGSHDVARILTELQKEIPSHFEKEEIALKRLKMLVVWQMTFPGVPSIYYGDEAGLTGGVDPENRKTYPWGRENQQLVSWHKELAALRKTYEIFQTGEWKSMALDQDVYGYVRQINNGQDAFGQAKTNNTALVLFNRSFAAKEFTVNVNDLFDQFVYDFLEDCNIPVQDGKLTVKLSPLSAKILMKERYPKNLFSNRGAGVLLHITSLPSKYGIGDLGKSAYQFIDYLKKSKQRYWQILPIHPVDANGSPYQSDSAFAGNLLLIDVDQLVRNGWLTKNDVKKHSLKNSGKVDYAEISQWKQKLLKKAFVSFQKKKPASEFNQFVEKHRHWLEDYSLYKALKDYYEQTPWNMWPPAIAKRENVALAKMREQLKEEVEFYQFVQFVFFTQWEKLKEYANSQHIEIIGDIPIFVAHDSCDVWVNAHLFDLDELGNPAHVAGVPPDYFSKTGQRWGNPLYLWEKMKEDGYQWWLGRIRHLSELVDIIRIDHFRGFESFWSIPAEEETAVKGRWEKGPREHFFETLKKELKDTKIIAEDLGIITPAVTELRERYQFPGMKVLQFLPNVTLDKICRFPLADRSNVFYTGTHDNETLWEWVSNKSEVDETKKEEICWNYVEQVYASYADTVIIPFQDLLGLGKEGRMNTPSTTEGNWQWQLKREQLTEEITVKLRKMVKQTARE